MVRGTPRSDRYAETRKKVDRAIRELTRSLEFRRQVTLIRRPIIRIVSNRMYKNIGTLDDNLEVIRNKIGFEYRKVVQSIVEFPGSYVGRLGGSIPTEYKADFDLTPPKLFKYVGDKTIAEYIVKNGEFKYGCIGEYRINDENECKDKTTSCPDCKDLFDVIESEVLLNMTKQENIDVDSLFKNVDSYLESNFFIGCFTENSDPDYMWGEYANDYGVCIEFEPEDLKLYKVIYKDYLEEYRVLKDKFREIMYRISKDNYADLKNEIKSLTEDIVTLSLLCFYRKDSSGDYYREGEWREIIPRTPDLKLRKTKDGKWDFAMKKSSRRILKVTSCMTDEDNAVLKQLCLDQDIDFDAIPVRKMT